MGTEAQLPAWNGSFMPPFHFALQEGALTPGRIRFGLDGAWFAEEELLAYLLARWEAGQRDDLWEPFALMLSAERDTLRASLREVSDGTPDDGFWVLTALSWLYQHRDLDDAWRQLTELWYWSSEMAMAGFAADWDVPMDAWYRPRSRRKREVADWQARIRAMRNRLGTPMIDWIP